MAIGMESFSAQQHGVRPAAGCFIHRTGCCAQRARALAFKPAGQARRQRCSVVRAQKTDEKVDKDTKDKMVKGLDKSTAKKILKLWDDAGAKSPDALRKMLVNRSLRAVGVAALQTVLDAGAAWGGFSTANYLSQSPDFFGKVVVEFLAYFLGIYFASGVFFDAFALGLTAYAGVQYSTNTEAFMAAVREVAGVSGINVLDKAQNAVNVLKVISALNAISDVLQGQAGDAGAQRSTLQNLTAFLTLSKAEEKGFDPSRYSLTEEQAGQLAAVFAKYDTNDDMVLELAEVQRLFDGEGYNLSEGEVREAVKIIDRNGDGLVQFEEFVDWLVNKVDAKKVAVPSS